jgi:hypothetical protein
MALASEIPLRIQLAVPGRIDNQAARASAQQTTVMTRATGARPVDLARDQPAGWVTR